MWWCEREVNIYIRIQKQGPGSQADSKDGMERLGNNSNPKHQVLGWTITSGKIPMHASQASFSVYNGQDQCTLQRNSFTFHLTICLLW